MSSLSNLRKPFYSLYLHFHPHFTAFSIDEVRLKRMDNFPPPKFPKHYTQRRNTPKTVKFHKCSAIFSKVECFITEFQFTTENKKQIGFGQVLLLFENSQQLCTPYCLHLGQTTPTALPWYSTAFKHGVFYRLLANTFHLRKYPAISEDYYSPPPSRRSNRYIIS